MLHSKGRTDDAPTKEGVRVLLGLTDRTVCEAVNRGPISKASIQTKESINGLYRERSEDTFVAGSYQ
ncbi:hypothetical protein N7456_006894 [Penicillium angulare]|uniref:Uncharacterized protein n=1 Tax=Penicillium angulare TaxID=116970 RepID=A0A9W9FIL5_9EURO|nr:hypothetical protein N7456_006894 [Penicillium angulare]